MTEYECDKGHRWFSESETRCPQCFPPVVPVNDGGPAFPTNGMTIENWHAGIAGPGMSLRDYFAGQALAGNLASQSDKSYWPMNSPGLDGVNDEQILRGIAQLSYALADAMLAARAARSGG